MALYCPKWGYYERKQTQIGRAGDFFTSPSSGPLFGQLLGFQFAGWLEQITDQPVQLVETGAHQGDLARDILASLRTYRPRLFDRLEYWIVESSAARRLAQQERLQEFTGKLRWLDAMESVPETSITGVVFSNEFLDALPVHRLGWDASARGWFEWGVAVHQDSFAWQRLPVCPAFLPAAMSLANLECPPSLQEVLPDDFTVEICPPAGHWWTMAARRLKRGYLLTMDYGMEGPDWFSPSRPDGTVRAYRKHHLSSDVLADPGEQDLTAHVNFSLLRNCGESEGLRTATFQTQEQFLIRVWQQAWETKAKFLRAHAEWKRQFHTLTHPEHLGRAFRVLVQQSPDCE